jgi:RecB family exonuclease
MYSNSQLEMYKQCPKKYAYCYIEKIKSQQSSIPLVLGKAIHADLEAAYKHVLERGKFDYENLRKYETFEKRFWKEFHSSIVPLKLDEKPEDFIEQGKHLLRQYYDTNANFFSQHVMATEQSLKFKIGQYDFVGIIDRIDKTDRGLVVIDYKTSSKMPHIQDVQENTQLLLYCEAVRQNYGELPKKAALHMIKFNHKIEIDVTEEMVEHAVEQALSDILTIRNDLNFERKPGPLCPWCVYQDICRQELYEPKQSLSVWQYTHALRELEALKKQEAELKKSIDEFESTIEAGSYDCGDATVLVTEKKVQKYPKKGEKNYEDYLKTVEELGLMGDCQVFNAAKAKNIHLSTKINDEQRDVLKSFLTTETEKKVKLEVKE